MKHATPDFALSALRIAAELPALYDKIYLAFPAAYNGEKREGRFGGLKVVKLASKMKSKPETHFTGIEAE